MTASPLPTPLVTALTACSAVFLPADPPRDARIAFWRPDGTPPAPEGAVPDAATTAESGTVRVVLRTDDGTTAAVTVPALLLPVADALPVLTRARAAGTGTAAAYWGSAALTALQLAARGRLLPGLSASDHDAWRLGPLTTADQDRLRDLAAAMPPHAHAAPLPGATGQDGSAPPLLLPHPMPLLRSFLDAVADTLPRTPAAAIAAGGSAFTGRPAHRLPARRKWAADIATGHDAGVRLSLRIEALAGSARRDGDDPPPPRLRAVLQVHSLADPALLADAADVWAGTATALGPRARTDTLLALRRAAAAWEPLTPLLTAAVPDALDLDDEDAGALLGTTASRALAAAGIEVHWPRSMAAALTSHAVVGPDDGDGGPAGGTPRSAAPGLLAPDALLSFSWRFAVGDTPLTREELDRLAEAGRPVVRLRDRWVLIAPDDVRRALARQDRKVTVLDALAASLTGSADDGAGGQIEVRPTGRLAALRDLLSDPEQSGADDLAPPPGLDATLRGYQKRGLAWLRRMTSLGLGACLADDMGLGKTVTLIALHLARQTEAATAGPSLVVCPASLLGTWQRELAAFAPGTPVRRHHGTARDLDALRPGEVVLTTYGTLRRDAALLAGATDWSLVIADEAQHVKNPFSSTARQLMTVPARARVALTGTPVENNLTDLWAVLDWTTPGLLGPLPVFRSRYADAVEDGDPAAAERLARLVRPFLLRRRKSDPGIVPELPPKTETDHGTALTPEQAGLYEAVVREGLAEVSGADGIARRGLVVRLLTSLKQICNHPAQYLREESPRLAGRSGKLELFDELIDTIMAGDASVLVFTQYVRMARLLQRHLAERGIDAPLLHGGTPVPRREEMVRRFSAGEARVFLLSLKAAGTGLTLTRAEHVIHYDRWWNPAVEAQATDRVHRIGQQRPVQVHRLIAEGTVEDRIAALLARKQALADAVLGPAGAAALTGLSDAELAELVALDRTVTSTPTTATMPVESDARSGQ
ncbi:DEAD/DEAH box helicase [Streptomyces sp. RFCAC02]|uniref:DEAD/DEAH box helicase n=1 Tax=Streptomyces sp. RFCAC02 TaxID=2499143 RepID=UPI001020AB64|nr:DEAD/DEAH box helicase [Streptomyces sp. RFCAC02]